MSHLKTKKTSTKLKRKQQHAEILTTPSVQTTPPKQRTQKLQPLFWIVSLLAVALVGLGIWHSLGISSLGRSTAPTPVASTHGQSQHASRTKPAPILNIKPSPTPERSWQTFLSFSGKASSGTAHTQAFDVPSDWQITWTCKGVKGVDEALYIVIYNADGSLYNAGAQVTCLAAQQITESAEEHQSGKVYLSIDATCPWSIVVQKPG
jgi:hypothetical protein